MGSTRVPIYIFGVPSRTVRRQNQPRNPAARPAAAGDDGLRPDQGTAPVRRPRTWQHRILAGGIMAVILPGGPGIALLVASRPAAQPLLASAVMIAIITAALNTAAAMYQARQETRRKEIERGAANELAAALARSIDDAHASPAGLPAGGQAEEAARVRADAAQLIASMTPAVLALLGQPPAQAGPAPQARIRPGQVTQDRELYITSAGPGGRPQPAARLLRAVINPCSRSRGAVET